MCSLLPSITLNSNEANYPLNEQIRTTDYQYLRRTVVKIYSENIRT